MTKRKRFCNLICVFCLLSSLFVTVRSARAETYHVDHQAQDDSGFGTEPDWSDAFKTLGAALAVASDPDNPGPHLIRVAEGTYRPDGDDNSYNSGISFVLPQGVRLQGGYIGLNNFGRDPNTRDIQKYETILSGDNNGNGGAHDNLDAKTVVKATNVSRTTVIDGFTIEHGNGAAVAGGISVVDGSPIIRRCTIRNCGGGGITIALDEEESYDPAIVSCVLEDNEATVGGGLRITTSGDQAGSDTTIITIVNTTFRNNRAEFGGGLYCQGVCVDISNPNDEHVPLLTLVNCLSVGNSTFETSGTELGGGMWLGACVDYEITNVTVYGNIADNGGGGLYQDPEGPCPGPLLTDCNVRNRVVQNSIFWANDDLSSSDGDEDQISRRGTDDEMTVRYSDIEGGVTLTGCGSDCGPPLMWSITNIQSDPLFLDEAGADFRLTCDSPCIDAADRTFIPEDEFDIDGDGISETFVDMDLIGEETPDLDVTSRVECVQADKDQCRIAADMGAYEREYGVNKALCDGDLNGDETVNVDDLLMLIGRYGPCAIYPRPCFADIDDDAGVCTNDEVNANDLLELIGQWGGCPTVPRTQMQIGIGGQRPEFVRDCEHECQMAIYEEEIEEDEYEECVEDCIFQYLGVEVTEPTD